MAETTGSNRRAGQLTGFMQFTLAMKTMEQPLASLMGQFSGRRMEGRTGLRSLVEQPMASLEFTLPMQIMEPSLVIRAQFSERRMEGKTGLVRQAACLTSFWEFLLQTQILERLLGYLA